MVGKGACGVGGVGGGVFEERSCDEGNLKEREVREREAKSEMKFKRQKR